MEIKNDVVIEIIKKEEGQESYSHPEQLIKASLFYMGRIDEQGNDIPKEKWEENRKWDYDPEVDYVCVIFDRDYRDLDRKLPELYQKCKEHHIFIAISNPNFELWLLMHFPNIIQYDRELLLQNPKNLRYKYFPDRSKDKKYLEILLSLRNNGYKKGARIDFECFKDKVPLAIEQAKLFCQEPELLAHELGSSVGKLLEKMKE